MRRFGPRATLAASCAFLGLAPLVMPGSYSWIEHGVSESAAQAVPFAWVARIGFVLFGASVIWIATRRRRSWQQPGTALLTIFGLALFGVAAFSARSWEPDRPFSPRQDDLHSVFATMVGAAFVLGLASVLIAGRATGSRQVTTTDSVVLLVALLVPLAGSTPMWGVLQRTMFAGAYIWFASEAANHNKESRRPG